MPKTCCSVPGCHERGGHEYPSDPIRRAKWVQAVRRLDENTMKMWTPTKSSVVCKKHFTPDDYIKETIFGLKPGYERLLATAVPSIFPWTTAEGETAKNRKERALNRDYRKSELDRSCKEDLERSFTEHVDFVEEVIETETFTATPLFEDEFTVKNCMTQTDETPMFSIERFSSNNELIHFYTGLESYAKFMFVLNSLGPAAYCLKYIYFQISGISVENQLFMTLMKLRRYSTNFELSTFFSVSESSVKNIVYTWIIFMSKQWREANIWPSQNLVRYFMPSDFKLKFPKTRIIIDGTECPIKKPKAPRAQQSTYSTYKNRNTIKVLVGTTPGGLVNYISEAYGGSTSDRQIVERCKIVNACDPGDSVMADKGFNVQDLFATANVRVNVPTFFKKKNRMSGKIVVNDRKISSKRVHIERIIGLGKTYKILTCPLTGTETKLSSHITYVCFMLCNFKTCIVPKHA
ncbi:uncharacterized protein LOC128555267 [Mercenaria mercenaria]|uniref:uncharacterized protein LOC128555267 n=1 Tax=Mercenaria mercenaria TaxID=6596 RepID=UPI00234E9721|nr:uncharacterized protein LOC128555267 [Mercenaria mercenaria]